MSRPPVLTIAFALIGLASSALAGSGSECEERLETHSNTQISQHWFEGSQNCYLTVSPRFTKDLIYRFYVFNNQGLLMVFNSYGEGPSSTMTGAREFYFFPRSGMPAFSAPFEDRVQVKTAAGTFIDFDAKVFSPIAISGGWITEDPKLSPDNQGGVEIGGYPGLVLDLGFRLGDSPAGNPTRQSDFIDSSGERCRVTNSELFAYTTDGDSKLRFPTDAGLAEFLKKRCPNLKLDGLIK